MYLDPRGLRFGAALTTAVLAAVLVTGNGWLLLAQAAVFGLGVFAGPARTPYGWLFRTLVRPRLAPPAELEDPAPPRFAQTVGLAFAAVGVAGLLGGAHWLGLVATAFAFVAAFLNAAFGFCLGCEMYLIIRRTTARGVSV